MRLCLGLAFILFTGIVYATNDQDAERIIDENEVTQLQQISHVVRTSSFVDITLPRETFQEECFVRPPNGQLTRVDDLENNAVKVQEKSDFVNCRVTIGPMTTNLLGDWQLCGQSISNKKTRCQSISISWDANNGDGTFSPVTEAMITHEVDIGKEVNVVINENNAIGTCHVVTPAGEDLVITEETNYPHIARDFEGNSCNIVIKDITQEMLGNWLVSAKMPGPIGQTETRQPLSLKLYGNVDEDNEVIYNVTVLDNQEHRVKVGTNLGVEVTHPTGSVENCIYKSPAGLVFDNDSSDAPKGVQFRNSDEKAVCKINFTPITEETFGEWQITGKFKDGDLFDELRLTFQVIEEASEEDDVNMLSQIVHSVVEETLVDISLNKELYEEECYLRPPEGDLTRTNMITMTGVKTQQKSDFVSCRVTIGPITKTMLGVWSLCGKSLETQELRCQPAEIRFRTGNWGTRNRTQFTHPVHFGGTVHSGVSEVGDVGTCHVVTPLNENLVLTNDVKYPHIELSHPNSCSVIFKNITENMLGSWLIYGSFHSILLQYEVRLPLVFKLYDENDPFATAYNVTNLGNQNHLVHIDRNLTVEVSQQSGDIQDCIFTSPSGGIFSMSNENDTVPEGVQFIRGDTRAVCQIVFSPITEEALGVWHIHLRTRNAVMFDERRQTFTIIAEDPENPLKEDIVREIQYLPEQNINTDMNTVHRITISGVFGIQPESCHLVAPDERQYAFIDGFNVPNVEIINDNNLVECGVTLNIAETSMIGTWTLLSRARRNSNPIERRLPVTIRVEENFVLQNDIHIRKGADLYLHLNDAISIPETCRLIGPDGNDFEQFEVDPVHVSACGYIVRDVNVTHNGIWVIEYGLRIKKRGSVKVEVIDSEILSVDNLRWTIGDSLDIPVGPEDAVYCIIRDGFGRIVFDDFGQCRIVLERVSVDHKGTWSMHVGKPGAVQLQRYDFNVEVQSVDGLPIVMTNVDESLPSVLLTCSVPAQHEVNACKFRDPMGNILVAAHGVGQDNYTFHGAFVNYESDAHSHDCTLRLLNPSPTDIGIWRCGLDTSTGSHYGFLNVMIPHLLQNTAISVSINTEPVLQSANVTYLEGEPVSLSCSISSALRYCYFRAPNGTTYNAFPRMSAQDNFEYVGAGLDAGECGIRFNRFSPNEGGLWSCHVGLLNPTAPELRAFIQTNVTEKMSVRHYWMSEQTVAIEARVYNGEAIDYCRFVRINGEGFTTDNVPERYELEPLLQSGACILRIPNPNILDLHPWTVVAKLVVGGGEISKTTTNNMLSWSVRNPFADIFFWLVIVFLCITIVAVAGACVPKKNREWTYRRASGMSRSFRSSFNKTFSKKPAVTSAPTPAEQNA